MGHPEGAAREPTVAVVFAANVREAISGRVGATPAVITKPGSRRDVSRG